MNVNTVIKTIGSTSHFKALTRKRKNPPEIQQQQNQSRGTRICPPEPLKGRFFQKAH